MKQRPAMIIATVLTAFVLVVVGGVIARLSAAPAGNQANSAPTASVDPDIIATYEQRELELRQQIEKQNEAITKANEEFARIAEALTAQPADVQLPAPIETLPPVTDPGLPPASESPVNSIPPTAAIPTQAPAPAAPQRITAEQAANAARAYVGGGTVTRVELEQEHGALVYEVRFANDSRVYVDPASGQVVYAKLRDKESDNISNDAPQIDDNSGGGDDNDDNSGSGGDDDDDDNSGSGGGDDDDDDDGDD